MVDDIVREKGYLTLGSRFRRLGERLQSDVQQIMDVHGVPVQVGHYPLLASLDENGPLPVGDLAAALGVAQPGVTRSVAQLENLGVVAVRRGKSDQRTRIVALTSRGEEVVRVGRRDIWPSIERGLATIMADRQGPLLDLLDHLEDALKDRSLLQRSADE